MSEQRSPGLVRYPIRLEGDIWAYLDLPTRLTLHDVARITALMNTLIFPPSPDEYESPEYMPMEKKS